MMRRSFHFFCQAPSIAFLILVSAAWLLWLGEPSSGRVSTQAVSVPDQFGLWMGTPLSVDPRAFEILDTNAVDLMEYRMGQEPPVWFAQVAGFGTRAAFHPPELCYVGSHFEVLERGPISVMVNGQSRRLMRLAIAQGKDRFEAWYWFTANGRVTSNYYQQQFWLVVDAIRRKPLSGTLVRISTAVDDPQAAHRRLLAFVTAFDGSMELEPLTVALHDPS